MKDKDVGADTIKMLGVSEQGIGKHIDEMYERLEKSLEERENQFDELIHKTFSFRYINNSVLVLVLISFIGIGVNYYYYFEHKKEHERNIDKLHAYTKKSEKEVEEAKENYRKAVHNGEFWYYKERGKMVVKIENVKDSCYISERGDRWCNLWLTQDALNEIRKELGKR